MKTITIRELRKQTGRWVREASARRRVTKMTLVAPLLEKPFFANPRYTRAYLRHRNSLRDATDSTETISQVRDREVE